MPISFAPTVCAAVPSLTAVSHKLEDSISCIHHRNYFFFPCVWPWHLPQGMSNSYGIESVHWSRKGWSWTTGWTTMLHGGSFGLGEGSRPPKFTVLTCKIQLTYVYRNWCGTCLIQNSANVAESSEEWSAPQPRRVLPRELQHLKSHSCVKLPLMQLSFKNLQQIFRKYFHLR